MKGCRKYSSAGKNRLETHETQERKTLVGETEEEEKWRSLISPIPPRLACPRWRRISYALAYFVSPNAGLVVVHGTSGTTKKSQTSLFTKKPFLLTVLCRRNPVWTHLVPWMRNISYSRCLFWVCSAWIRKISLYLRTKDRIKQKNIYCFNYEEKDFLTISTAQKKDTFDSLELACVEGAG